MRLRPVDVLLEPGDTKMRRPERPSTGMLGREQLGVLHERSLVHLLQRRSGPTLRVPDQSAHVLLLVPDANVRAAPRPRQSVRSVRTFRVRGQCLVHDIPAGLYLPVFVLSDLLLGLKHVFVSC